MKKIVLLFFIFFAITARVDFAKASTIANPAYTFIVSKSYNSSDRPRILRDFFILNIGTSYGFKQ